MLSFDLFDITSCLLGFVDTSSLPIQKHDTRATRVHPGIMHDVVEEVRQRENYSISG